METRRGPGRLLWGAVLILLGLIFLLDNLGYGWWFSWGRWWPLILIVLGGVMLYRRERVPPAEPASPGPAGTTGQPPAAPPVRRRFPTGPIVLIGIGVAFLLQDYLGGNALPALILIAIGVALVLRDRALP